MYSYGSWDHYWEGTFKRNNQNLGTVSTAKMCRPDGKLWNNE